jgi:hypothetical protein
MKLMAAQSEQLVSKQMAQMNLFVTGIKLADKQVTAGNNGARLNCDLSPASASSPGC